MLPKVINPNSKAFKKEVAEFKKKAGVFFLLKRHEQICKKCQHSYWVWKEKTPKEHHKNIFKYCSLDADQSRLNWRYATIFTDLNGRWKKRTVKEYFKLSFLPTDCPFILEHQVLGKENEEKAGH